MNQLIFTQTLLPILGCPLSVWNPNQLLNHRKNRERRAAIRGSCLGEGLTHGKREGEGAVMAKADKTKEKCEIFCTPTVLHSWRR
ncbi:hypothetical protein MFRU_009g00200 [Monilinia fructicola]|nr:hypothetical protein MFRU_009g00200 [Monilinia fructicola]